MIKLHLIFFFFQYKKTSIFRSSYSQTQIEVKQTYLKKNMLIYRLLFAVLWCGFCVSLLTYCAALLKTTYISFFFSFANWKDLWFCLEIVIFYWRLFYVCTIYLFKKRRYFSLNLTVIMHFDKSTHCSLTLNLKLRVNAVHQGPRNMLLMCKCTKNFSLFF